MTRFDPMEAELEWDRLAGLEAERLEGHGPAVAWPSRLGNDRPEFPAQGKEPRRPCDR